MRIGGLDHVQIGFEEGGEDRVRQFYGGVLGLTEVEKPAALAGRGGCWFVGDGVQLHLGVERPFSPSPRAHVALLVSDLDEARALFAASQVEVLDDDSDAGFARFYVRDPFGNRIEIVDARDAGFTRRQAARGRGASLFSVAPAEQYDRFVGRYSSELARALIAAAGVRPGSRAIDVGCGPGALATELVKLLGRDHVSAVDPSQSFVEACQARLRGVDVRVASAEALPYPDDDFDHALAQLVVNFMADAPAGVREMARVTRPGGTVAAAVWDYRGEMTMLRRFWDAVAATDREGRNADEAATMPFVTPHELGGLLESTGLRDVVVTEASPTARYESFDDLWSPFEAGIGPAGAYVARLDGDARALLRAEYRTLLGVDDRSFGLAAKAWVAVGTVA